MSGWNQDDFLEAMMPVLRKKQGPDWCPDAETLGAVVEGNVSDALKEAVAAHTATCPVCAGLHERLRNFDQASFAQDEAAWGETEKRLDNWMQGVLAIQGRPGGKPEPKSSRWPEKLSHFFVNWRMQLAMGAAAVVIVVVCVRLVVTGPAPAQIAARSTPAERPTAATPSPVDGNTGTAPTSARPKQAPPIRPNLSAKHNDATKGPLQREAAAVPTPPEAKPQAELAKSVPPSLPFSPANPEPAAPAAQTSQPTLAAPPVTQVNEPSRLAKSVTPPSSNGSPRGLTALRATAGSNRAVSLGASGPPLPAAMRIEAGTRVWIMLKSVNNQADGSFEFRGMVLLPTTQAGAVLLDRGTDIQGSGKVVQGRTSLQISEFSVRGVRYRLKDVAGAMSAQVPGAGGAVQFDTGQVFEMWMGSSSAYERVTGENASPQK
jgi:hypothetical protein